MAFTEEQQAAIDEANLRASQANANYSPEQQAAIDEAEAKAGRGVVEKSVNWLFGGEREENIPTLFDGGNAGMGAFNWPKGKKTKVVSLITTTNDEQRLKSGLSDILPGSTFSKDRFDNLVVTTPIYRDGKPTEQVNRFYPNPKGMDATNAMQISGVGALATGLGKAAQIIGLPMASWWTAAGLGATEAGVVEGTSAALSNDTFKTMDVPLGAIGGIGGKYLGNLVGKLSAWLKKPAAEVVDENGLLKPEVVQAMTEAGVDVDAVTVQMAQETMDQTSKGVDPLEAARIAAAGTLPIPVPLTKGEVTGSAAQQIFEREAAKGVYGEGPSRIMTGVDAEKQAALAANVPAIQQKIAGTSDVIQRGQAGAAAQSNLANQRDAAQRQASDLYTRARARGAAFMDPIGASSLSDEARMLVRDNYSVLDAPSTTAILDDLDEVVALGGDVNRVFQIRRQLVNAGAAGSPDRSAASAVNRLIDGKLEEMANNALISGDQEAVTAWAKAIKNYKTFKTTWDTPTGILSKLTEKVGKDGDTVLKISPEAASNAILGVTNNNIINAGESARTLLTLKKNLPKNEWDGIRQEVFLNFAEKARKENMGDKVFSGVSFNTSWKRFAENNPTAMKGLFSPKEIKLINQFSSVAARATGGASNTSNTAAAASGLLQSLAKMLGATNSGRFVSRVTPGLKAIAGVRASNVTQNVATQNPTIITPGIGGGLSTQEEVRQPPIDLYNRGANYIRRGLLQ